MISHKYTSDIDLSCICALGIITDGAEYVPPPAITAPSESTEVISFFEQAQTLFDSKYPMIQLAVAGETTKIDLFLSVQDDYAA